MSVEDNAASYGPVDMAPAGETNELSEHFKKQVDREALRDNLKLTPAQRVQKMLPASPPTIHEGSVHYATGKSEDLVEAFKRDVDRTLFIENLKLTPAQRMEKFIGFMEMMYELRRAGREMRERESKNVS